MYNFGVKSGREHFLSHGTPDHWHHTLGILPDSSPQKTLHRTGREKGKNGKKQQMSIVTVPMPDYSPSPQTGAVI